MVEALKGLEPKEHLGKAFKGSGDPRPEAFHHIPICFLLLWSLTSLQRPNVYTICGPNSGV